MLHAMLHVCVLTRYTVSSDYFIFLFSSRNDIESLKTELDKLRLSVSVASSSGATSGRGRGREGKGEGEGEREREREMEREREEERKRKGVMRGVE